MPMGAPMSATGTVEAPKMYESWTVHSGQQARQETANGQSKASSSPCDALPQVSWTPMLQQP